MQFVEPITGTDASAAVATAAAANANANAADAKTPGESTLCTDPNVHTPRPRDNELDMFGLTHIGHVRQENQDHFLLATVHPQLMMHGTSLPDTRSLLTPGQRLASILLVADGVGGRDRKSVV